MKEKLLHNVLVLMLCLSPVALSIAGNALVALCI